MKNFVDYTPRKCFASACVALVSAKAPRLRDTTHTRQISFSGLVIQITITSLCRLKLFLLLNITLKDYFVVCERD
jgi:hypothetical protein